MGLRIYRDIEVRGVVYATAQDCARALGVTDQAVRRAVRSGCTRRLGLRQAHVEPMAVRIRDRVFPDARAAAAAFDVGVTAIYAAIARGEIDRIGLPPRRRNPKSLPIVIGGLRFASMAEAERALGFRPGYIAHSRKLGRRSAMEKIVAAAMREARRREGGGPVPLRPPGVQARPVEVAGLRFASAAEAARVLGYSVGYIAKALRLFGRLPAPVIAVAEAEAARRAAAAGDREAAA